MAWEKRVTSSYAQWVDLSAADGWIPELDRRVSVARVAELEGRPWAEQMAASDGAMVAASNIFRALNLPPLSSPVWRGALRKWFGATRTTTDASMAQKPTTLTTNTLESRGGEFGARILAWWRALGKELGDWDLACMIIIRLGLTWDARVFRQCASGRVGEGICDFESGFFVGGATSAGIPTAEGFSPYTWRTLMWRDPPVLLAGLGAGRPCRIERALPPLAWHVGFLQDVARELKTRGAVGTLDEARAFVTAANARTARAMDMLPAELAGQAAALPADVEGARWTDPGLRQAAAAIAQTAAIVGAANPTAGAIIGLGAAIVALLPGAVGTTVDEFGRAEVRAANGVPGVFERGSIEDFRVNDPPPWTVPAAPGAAAPLRFLAPLVITTTRTDGVLNVTPVQTPPAAPEAASGDGWVAPVLIGGAVLVTGGLLLRAALVSSAGAR